MKRIYRFIMVLSALTVLSSCEKFLTTYPYDALSPATTWKTDADAEKFVVGCYDDWADRYSYLYWDCTSDFGYSNFDWDAFRCIGNGSMSPSNTGWSLYNFATIRKCNTYLENAVNVQFSSEDVKNNLEAQVRAIRAYRYFLMNFLYGGVPIVKNYQTVAEAKVARNSEEEVRKFVYDELDSILTMIAPTPSQRGRIARDAVQAIKMRAHLYWEDWAGALAAAQELIATGRYSLEPDYARLFTLDGKTSPEIILQYMTMEKDGTYSYWENGQMYPNADGGWSSMVPTMHLVDNYEMANGKTREDPDSGYDPSRPFDNRDPRLYATVLYPGVEWQGRIFNTLDEKIDASGNGDPSGSVNPDYPSSADNASKTALSWRKWLDPMYEDIWENSCCPILFRYAEVLLTAAEAENELNGPTDRAFQWVNAVRSRVGMPAAGIRDYPDKAAFRTLVRRERGSEFAGEGLRRFDILRWKDDNGKILAETLLNETLTCIKGTVKNGVATISDQTEVVEERVFKSFNRYLPIPQSDIDNNPNLTQNEGYVK